MDNSTKGVTLYCGFISDLLGCYEKSRSTFAKGLFEMAEGLDLSEPTRPVSMKLYNDMCQWIEDNLGSASLRRAGAAIGARAYDQMVATGVISAAPSPLEIMEALKTVASVMIQDPKGRGWEVLRHMDDRLWMRRTQTFNCILQEGLLRSLVEHSGAMAVSIRHSPCTRKEADFCEYEITWMV